MNKFSVNEKVKCKVSGHMHHVMNGTPDYEGDIRIYYKGTSGDWTFRKENQLERVVPLVSAECALASRGSDHGSPKGACGVHIKMETSAPTPFPNTAQAAPCSDHGSPKGACGVSVKMECSTPEFLPVTLKEKKVTSPSNPNLSEETPMPSPFEANQTCGNAAPSRRTVTLTLIDPDTSLDVADSVVFTSGVIVAEDDTQTVIQQLIVDGEVGAAIKEHNIIRAAQTDINILKNTGKTVGLLPAKLKDLQWEIK